MVKTKLFMGTVTKPSVEDELNKFIKELTSNQIVDVKFNTNLANIKKNDGTTDLIVISSSLIIYEEE